MPRIYNVLGLMSGSSLDGLDMALARFCTQDDGVKWELLQAQTAPYPDKWVTRLRHLPEQNALTFAKTHAYFGHFMGELVNDFLKNAPIRPDFIASHGHTIFHQPHHRLTVQIGDGAALAAKTGLSVISDFRTQDVALDGEGTPLAPIADKFLFPDFDFYLNIGGIANISSNAGGRWIAFDIAPANQILNALANLRGLPFDPDGSHARQGSRHLPLLDTLSAMPYFTAPYPKSLDNTWIRQRILPFYIASEATLEDKLHTACLHLAEATVKAVGQIVERERLVLRPFRMLVTGGGGLNVFLMEMLKAALNQHFEVEVVLPERSVIEYKEALLMGLMGVLRFENRANVLQSVTGSQRNTVGGAIWCGQIE